VKFADLVKALAAEALRVLHRRRIILSDIELACVRNGNFIVAVIIDNAGNRDSMV
jgi:hypothetical protein